MKKILSLIALTAVIVVITSCSSAKNTSSALQKESEGLLFEYTAITRGSYKSVVVTPTQITTAKNRDKQDSVTKKLTADEWKAVYDYYKAIKDVNTIRDLEAPSKKHQYDGALAATLTINVADQVYNSSTFDHGNPPAEIKPLVDKIIALSDLDKK